MEPRKEIMLPHTGNEAEHTTTRLFSKKKKKDAQSNQASRSNYLFIGNRGDRVKRLQETATRQVQTVGCATGRWTCSLQQIRRRENKRGGGWEEQLQ